MYYLLIMLHKTHFEPMASVKIFNELPERGWQAQNLRLCHVSIAFRGI